MIQPSIKTVCSLLVVLLATRLYGCKQAAFVDTPSPTRRVRAIELSADSPYNNEELVGSVAAWKQEDLSFEVSGRLTFVAEPGSSVSGPSQSIEFGQETFTIDEMSTGDVVATIDNQDYKRALAQSQSQLAVLAAQRDALEVQLSSVVPAQLVEAEAAVGLAERDFERNQRLLSSRAVSQAEFDASKTDLEAKTAKLTQVEASRDSTAAELRSLDAQLAQQRVTIEQAEENLNDCSLRAPFGGEISDTRLVSGGMAKVGSPVLTLTLMDPLKVEVTLPSAMERSIAVGDALDVHVDSSTDALKAQVISKSTVADARTRTFGATLLVRNRKIAHGALQHRSDVGVVAEVVSELSRILPMSPGATDGPMVVDVRALVIEGDATYVWKVNNLPAGQSPRQLNGPLKLQRVQLTVNETVIDHAGIYQFIEVKSSDDLSVLDAVAIGIDVEDSSVNELVGIVRQEDWLLRPGDVVRVSKRSQIERGIFVPLNTVVQAKGQPYVFTVKRNEAKDVARRVSVSTGEIVGDRVRIESQELGAGDVLVTDGVAFIRDGEAVDVDVQRAGAER